MMRLLRRTSPKHAEGAERESGEWYLICPKCGTARSYSELGWVRYGAWSRGKRMLHPCPTCGRRRWHKVERHSQRPGTPAA